MGCTSVLYQALLNKQTQFLIQRSAFMGLRFKFCRRNTISVCFFSLLTFTVCFKLKNWCFRRGKIIFCSQLKCQHCGKTPGDNKSVSNGSDKAFKDLYNPNVVLAMGTTTDLIASFLTNPKNWLYHFPTCKQMVVDRSNVDHIMRGLQSTEGVRLHNHRKKLRQRFDIIKKLGQGTYGKVQLGINKETGQEVAIKTIKKCKIETEADLVRIRREIQIMSSVRHPNIIHIYEVFENREKIVLVMEYAAGGELYDYLSERKVLEETEARRIFRQVSTAIYYCHKHKICHRDLKLENILLDEHGSAKIADFGLSNVFDGQRLLSTYCGSPLYASPEIVKGTPYHGPEVDCWSLGVLLYTLVYGAMPFDGSNFKRLVKQISQGDYFEPKKASSASPLIRDMLTVNSPDRATIQQICSHWWVNQGFNVSCLDIAEDLANQTPVRLDLLLSLAPPPENTEKIVVTDDQNVVPQEAPPRSMSVGSFMDLDQNAEERVRSFVAREVPSDTPSEKPMKRKLETAPSKSFSGARKKERTKPETEGNEEPVLAETEPSAKKVESNNAVMEVDTEEVKSSEKAKTEETSETKPAEKPVEVPVPESENSEKPEAKKPEEEKVPEAISKDKPTRKSVKVVKKKIVEKKDSESEKKEGTESADAKAKLKKKTEPLSPEEELKKDVKEGKPQEKEPGKEIKSDSLTRKSRGSVKQNESEEKEKTPRPEESPTKPVERRKSKIFETAEKFMSNDQKSPTQEKPKKVYIPGVKVSDFAKAFERRSSVPSTPPLKSSPSRKTIIKDPAKKEERKSPENKSKSPEKKKEDSSQVKKASPPKEPVAVPKEESPKAETKEESPEQKSKSEHKPTPINDEKLKKLKDSARNVISNALVEEERKKIKKQILKPPVPRTKTEDLENRRKSLTLQIGKETATVQVHTPENTKFLFEPDNETPTGDNKENIEKPKEKKTAKLEITLKSNTLPRRTSKAEVRLSTPQPKKEVENFRTEVEHRVGDPSHVYSTQRSEVAFPVSAAQKPMRSMSLEPESRPRNWQSRERIIPIQVEGGGQKEENEARDRVKELDRPHEGRAKLPYQRTWSLRSNSLSRQSTQDSDTESTMSTTGEPIKKSPREFIIPIAVEGGGYVTPRATSLEPSESMSSKRSHRPFSRKFSLFSDNGSEDESPFSTLRDEPFRLHRLRSSRPARTSVERADSASGSEEEEDDDGFELLTAENLFSTLLSRVRSLTQRLNVEDGLRPGFPSSRLLSNHFGPSERLFSNFHQPLTRLPERSEFARSLSRDMENGSSRISTSSRSDMRNSESNRSIPRGNSKSKRSDSDTESISESSAASNLPRKQEERKGKKSRSHSGSANAGDGEEVTEYVPTFDGSRSLYVPSRMWTAKTYEKRNSDSDAIPPTYRSSIPKLLRPTSLLLERFPRNSVERESDKEKQTEEPKEKDFYDILAEKYGITNVIRYDLPRNSRTRYLTDNLVENRRCYGKQEKKEETESKEEKPEEEEKEAPPPPSPSTPKKEETVVEKFKTPSEKLAAVLNRLEGNRKQEKKEAIPVEKKPGNEPLSGLSSDALEIYEKTLAEYKKLKETRYTESEDQPGKSRIPRKITTRHQSDSAVTQTDKESNTPERSVLSKYFRNPNVEPEQKENEEPNEGVGKKKDGRNPKNKFLTSLERKLERLRATSEKKYVDKAIRSLRESSLGPKDVSSENVLIKRAVSLSDCPSYKNSHPGKIQSTVNSVLGMFKKLENSDKKKEKAEAEKQEAKPQDAETGGGEKSKIPIMKKPEPQIRVETPKSAPRNLEPLLFPSHTMRRTSHFTGNGFGFHRPTSPATDDSPTFLSPDLESFDSWSNCSDSANLDDVFLHGKYSKLLDDVSKESVSDRIRRKSFYSRFNERKKPRRSSLLSCHEGEDSGRERLTYARSFSGNPTEARGRPSYCRSVSTGDEVRPRPFYKTETNDSPTRRKNSFDWTRSAGTSSYLRTPPTSPSGYSSLTLPRNFPSRRSASVFCRRSPEVERPLGPVRPHSPRPLTPSGFSTSQSPNNFE